MKNEGQIARVDLWGVKHQLKSPAISRWRCNAITIFGALAWVMCGSGALAAEEESGRVIEEVVVTAQFREERIDDIALSISAYSGDELLEQRIRKPKDLAKLTPGVFMNESAVNQIDPEFTVRGIGTNDRNSNQNPAIALYVDGVAVPYNGMVSHALFDTERVEILKGPQGTLYGRNTTGGAMNFISRRPESEWGGYFHARYGQRNTTDLEGAFNVPIADSFALRFAGAASTQDGWQTIDVSPFAEPNDPTFAGEALSRRNGDTDREALRVSSLWTPSDQFEMLTIFDHGEDNSEVLGMKHAGNQQVDDPSAFCIFTTQGIRDETRCASFARDSRTATLIPVTVAGYDLFVQDPNDRGELVTVQDPFDDPRRTIKNFGQLGNRMDSRSRGITNQIDVALGRMTLTAVTGYRDFDRSTGIGQQGGPFRTIGGISEQKIEVLTQEFRLASDESWGRLNWVIGAIYVEEDVEDFLLPDLSEHEGFSAVFISRFEQKTEAAAAFGQIDYDISDTLEVIAGLRFTDESREFSYSGETFGAAPPVVPLFEEKVSDTEVTWKLGLNYRPVNNLLAYGSVATGFRGQGFPASIAFQDLQLFPFESETIMAYEAGIKSTLLGGQLQLNAAVYYYDWEDLQAASGVDREGIRLIVLTNAGDAQVKGAEVDAMFRPTDEWSFKVGLNWMDTEVQSGELENNELPRSPELMLNGFIRYESSQSFGPFTPFAQVNYQYNDDVQFEIPNKPGATEDGYWLFSAQAGVELPSGWEVSVWVDNLADETYRTEAFGPGSLFLPAGILFGPPRTVGASISKRF